MKFKVPAFDSPNAQAIIAAHISILEQQCDDLADQNRKNITRVERLKEAMLRHGCKDPKFHMKSIDERIAEERGATALKAAIDLYGAKVDTLPSPSPESQEGD